MVVASQTEPYTPLDLPSVAASADGTLAAVHEIGRITLVALPSAAAFAEIGVDPDADGNDIAWVGAPPRLLVLSRYPSNSTVHLLDPEGPRSIAEIRLDAPMRLAATVGASALAVGPSHAVILAATDTSLVPHQFLSRSMPTAVGAAANQFVVGLAGSVGAIEEWDPLTRAPKRRLRLPRMAAITAVGGSERLVWMATQQEPARIDVIPLVNRGQPKAHDLPEPIAQLLGHPRSDLVVCIGQSGRLYLIDLDGRQPLREIRGGGGHVASASLLVGRTHGILAAQAGHPLTIVPLDSREADPARAAGVASAVLPRPAPPAPFAAPPQAPLYAAMVSATAPSSAAAPSASAPAAAAASAIPASSVTGSSAAPAASPVEQAVRWPDTAAPSASAAPSAHLVEPSAIPAATPSAPSGEWPQAPLFSPDRLSPASARRAIRPELSWRDNVLAWTRAALAGAVDSGEPPAQLIDTVRNRFGLVQQLQPVLVMLYGAHLYGHHGVAPADIARLLHSWDEALGRGELARHAIADYAASRVVLSPTLLRVLDELPPLTGTLVGEPPPPSSSLASEPAWAPLAGPRCIIAAADESLIAIATRSLPHVHRAILSAHPAMDFAALAFEARAYGATAMLRIENAHNATFDQPALYVISDPDIAQLLGVPLLAFEPQQS